MVLPSPAMATEGDDEGCECVPKEEPPPPPSDGWTWTLRLGINGAFSHTDKVVGTPDGATAQLGALILATGNLRWGPHRLENLFTVQEGQTYTPQLASFVKNADLLELGSTYTFVFESLPWLGPYGRARMRTQILHSADVRTEPVTIRRLEPDGTLIRQLDKASGERYLLTNAFEPFILRESLGALVTPFEQPWLLLSARGGLAFEHIFTRGGFALTDDPNTPVIEYTRLQSSHQAGVEAEVHAGGEISSIVSWGAKAALFFPFYVSIPTPLKTEDLLNADLGGNLSVKITDWLSIDYVLTVRRVPLVLNDWQIQNQVLASVGYELK